MSDQTQTPTDDPQTSEAGGALRELSLEGKKTTMTNRKKTERGNEAGATHEDGYADSGTSPPETADVSTPPCADDGLPEEDRSPLVARRADALAADRDMLSRLVDYTTGKAIIDQEHWDVRELTEPDELEMAQRVIRLHHYAHRLPCRTNWRWYGLFHDQHPAIGPLNATQGGLCGVCVFGHTQAARDGLTKALRKALPPDMVKHIDFRGGPVELTRLWVADKVPHKAAGKLVKEARVQVGAPVVLSFADTAQQHEGRVYQTTRFTYTGLTAAHSDRVPRGMDHQHHASFGRGMTVEEMREKYGDDLEERKRSKKHRWIWFEDGDIRRAFFTSPANKRWREKPIRFLGSDGAQAPPPPSCRRNRGRGGPPSPPPPVPPPAASSTFAAEAQAAGLGFTSIPDANATARSGLRRLP